MKIKFFLIVIYLSGFFISMRASVDFNSNFKNNISEVYFTKISSTNIAIDSLSSTIVLPKDTLIRKKIISAICAFPFPFGFVGMHRVMLGTKPWIPVVYVATFGGGFGILPMIDFFVIIFKKDIGQLENCPNLFMWTK